MPENVSRVTDCSTVQLQIAAKYSGWRKIVRHKGTLCSRCYANPPRAANQRYCKACHADEQRQARKRAAYKLARLKEIVGEAMKQGRAI